MTLRSGAAACIAVVAFACAITETHAAQKKPAVVPASVPAKKSPFVKLAEPWPEADALVARRMEAEERPLFKSTDVLEFTLVAPFSALNKDHNPESSKRYPGTITAGGKSIDVQLSARGHFRRMARNCSWVPLRIEFPKGSLGGTVFDGQSTLKLGTGCEDSKEFEQITYREYLSYPLYNAITPLSFRARLARGTYIEDKSQKKLTTRAALFIENDSDVARRAEGRSVELPRVEFKDLDSETLTRVMLYQYAIGNTDFSIYALHNVRFVQKKDIRPLYLVPYDFDLSGFVHAPYASPDRRLGLRTVLDRMYRGPCRTTEEFDAAAASFRAKQKDMYALLESIAELDRGVKSEMKEYLDGFFRQIEKPEAIKKQFVNGCKPQPTM